MPTHLSSLLRFQLKIIAVAITAELCWCMPAAADAPDSVTMAPINAVVKAVNTSNPDLLKGVFTNDAVIIDEFTPYQWAGADAGAAWYSSLVTFTKELSITDVQAKIVGDPKTFIRDSKTNTQYVVFAAIFTGKLRGKPFTDTADWSFVLRCRPSPLPSGGTGGPRCDISANAWNRTSFQI